MPAEQAHNPAVACPRCGARPAGRTHVDGRRKCLACGKRFKPGAATRPDAGPPAGVRCPRCADKRAPVQATRRRGGQTVRQRKCRACGKVFWTQEEIRNGPPRPPDPGRAGPR
jgi:DNA-directed RNA polymerase subunit RPC12/RpoP